MSVDATATARNAIPVSERILVSEDEAAVMLSVSKPTLRKYVDRGDIPRVEVEGLRRNLYSTDDLRAFAASHVARR